MDHIRFGAEQSRDLGIVLPGEQLGHLRSLDFDLGHQLFHRRLKIGPGILSPGIVLVDSGNRLQFRLDVQDVQRCADVVHGRGGRGAEHILVVRVLEYARRAAIEEIGEFFQLFRDRCDRQAIAAGDIADHQIDFVALHQIAVLGDLCDGGARLVDKLRLDLRPAETFGRIGGRRLARVQHLDHDLGRVARRHAEGRSRRAREEGDDADFHRRRVLRKHRHRRQGQCCRNRRRQFPKITHDVSSFQFMGVLSRLRPGPLLFFCSRIILH